MFENNFTYDASGNILTQLRKDEAGDEIDELTYCYNRTPGGQLLQNRLYHVNDNPALTSALDDDLDDMGTFDDNNSTINTANNYGYDELGQLIRDDQEEISNIVWRNDGKIARIERSGSTAKTIEFGYNPSGERISKKILSGNTWEETTYYIRDAQV